MSEWGKTLKKRRTFKTTIRKSEVQIWGNVIFFIGILNERGEEIKIKKRLGKVSNKGFYQLRYFHNYYPPKFMIDFNNLSYFY